MRSLASAAALLGAAGPLDTLALLAADVGFRAAPLPLDPALGDTIGLSDQPVSRACLVVGPGALRALLLECRPGAPLRQVVAATSRRLAARAPYVLWLLFAAHGGNGAGEVAVAAWSATGDRQHVRTLLVEREHVLPSDAETFALLERTAVEPDTLAHAAWLDLLGREALTRRFYRALERVVGELARHAAGGAREDARAELALLCVSRLLFLSFLESKGWLDGERRFLALAFERCMERGGRFHERVLRPLFFGTLNTPPRARASAARAFGRVPFLNGGLFAPTPREQRCRDVRFTDESLGLVFGSLLGRFRFTAREQSERWAETAIDPEMLGKAFESLMGAGPRRESGAFYTPQSLVAHVAGAALSEALTTDGIAGETIAAALRGERVTGEPARLLAQRAAGLRVVDPACGSGAFLVHALETLATVRAAAGDLRPVATIRRELLTRSIYGVDVNPMAVWLCELRLWLSVVIESGETDPMAVTPLPNLDRNVRVGDALAGDAFADRLVAPAAALDRLRSRYARATGARKRTLLRALDRTERTLAVARAERARDVCAARRRDLIAALRQRDLFGARCRTSAEERVRLEALRGDARALRATLARLRDGGALPFDWATHFPHVARRFDVVIGNPPWVRLHRIPQAARARLRARYAAFRLAAWERGASLAGAGAGFAAQVDLSALFAERALHLARDGGTIALLLPMKLWHSLAGGGIRAVLASQAHLRVLEDWSESPATFEAAVYPSLLVARRERPTGEPAPFAAAVHRAGAMLRWSMPRAGLALDDDPASPWLLLPPAVRSAFDHLASAGVPLASSALGAPRLGVKSGCNEAFVVRRAGGAPGLATVCSESHRGAVEEALLRPVLRGEDIGRWRAAADHRWMLWTHAPDGAPLGALPPGAARWLARWRTALAARADVRGGIPWWSLFRTAAASPRHARVVWADIGRSPRALVLPPGDCTVPINSCYVLPCPAHEDALALAAILNSAVAAAWLRALAEPARGGYRRYLAWTIALLPVPRDWRRACELLVPLAERAMAGDNPAEDVLTDAVLRAYRVRFENAAPLLEWMNP